MEIGQLVKLADGTTGHIVRKTKALGINSYYDYWIVPDENGKPGTGRMTKLHGHVVHASPLPVAPTLLDVRQTMIAGTEHLISEKTKQKRRAA